LVTPGPEEGGYTNQANLRRNYTKGCSKDANGGATAVVYSQEQGAWRTRKGNKAPALQNRMYPGRFNGGKTIARTKMHTHIQRYQGNW